MIFVEIGTPQASKPMLGGTLKVLNGIDSDFQAFYVQRRAVESVCLYSRVKAWPRMFDKSASRVYIECIESEVREKREKQS